MVSKMQLCQVVLLVPGQPLGGWKGLETDPHWDAPLIQQEEHADVWILDILCPIYMTREQVLRRDRSQR